MIPVMQDTQKDQLSSAKQFEWKEYDLRKKIQTQIQKISENGLGTGGYPEQLIQNQVACAFQSVSNNGPNGSKKEKETGIPLVITYHPRPKDLSSLVSRFACNAIVVDAILSPLVSSLKIATIKTQYQIIQ